MVLVMQQTSKIASFGRPCKNDTFTCLYAENLTWDGWFFLRECTHKHWVSYGPSCILGRVRGSVRSQRLAAEKTNSLRSLQKRPSLGWRNWRCIGRFKRESCYWRIQCHCTRACQRVSKQCAIMRYMSLWGIMISCKWQWEKRTNKQGSQIIWCRVLKMPWRSLMRIRRNKR